MNASNRLFYYATLVCLSALAGLGIYGLSFAGSSGLASSDWPMYQHDPSHSGQSTFSGVSSEPWVIWETHIPYRGYGGGAGGSGIIKGADNTAYVSQLGGLYALNLRDGSIKWAPSFSSVFASGAPALGNDGRLYWGMDDAFAAISNTGQIAWRWVGLSGNGVFGSSPAISSDGTVYFAHSALWSFSANGSFNWVFPFDWYNHTSPAIAPDGTIYAGDSGKFYAINPNGSVKWLADFGFGSFTPPAIDPNGNVYVGTNFAMVFAFTPDGSQKWTFTADEIIYDHVGDLWGDSAGFSTSPAIGQDGTIYLASYYSGGVTDTLHLYAINPDGSLKWKAPIRGDNPMGSFGSSPVVDRYNRVYFCNGNVGWSTSGFCYGFDSGGRSLWAFPMGGSSRTTPLIVSDGIVILQNDYGFVYAIGDDSIPRRYVSPSSLNKVVEYRSDLFTATLQITSTIKPLTWTASITMPVAWLTMPITTGTTPGQIDLAIDPAALEAGEYRVNLLMNSDLGSIIHSQIVPITLTVNPPPPKYLYLPFIHR